MYLYLTIVHVMIQDSNTFIHQNYTISTWIDTLALVLNNCLMFLECIWALGFYNTYLCPQLFSMNRRPASDMAV